MKHILKTLFSGLLGAALSLSLLPEARAQTYTFFPNDATINSAVTTDYAIVGYADGSYDDLGNPNFTSPSSPTVQVTAGAAISSETDIYNNSVVNVSGGSVGALVGFDDSTVNVSGGNVNLINPLYNSVVNFSGGNVGYLLGQGNLVNISGGTVKTLIADYVSDIFSDNLGGCIVNVTGGRVTSRANATAGGILNLYGGEFDGDRLYALGGTINLYGSGLSASLIDPNYMDGGFGGSLYRISGTLEDGTALTNKNLFVAAHYFNSDGFFPSSFNLINTAAVPEPGSLALLLGVGVSGTGFVLRRRRK